MNDGISHRIERVDPKPGYRLSITWTTGAQVTVDFSEDVRKGGIWAPLRDPALFSRARVAGGGTILEWPEPADKDGNPRIDIDADGLYVMGTQQRVVPFLGKLRHLIFERPKTV
jgi:hypothetical protein